LDAAAEASEDPKMQKLVKLKTRVKQWIYARSVDSSALKFAEPDTEEAVSRILKYAEDSNMLKTQRRAHSPLLERRMS